MNDRRRVLILSDRFPPHDRGGSERVAYLHAQGLRARGWDVAVFTSHAPEAGARPAVQVEDGLLVHRVLPLHPFSTGEVPSLADSVAELSLELWNPWMEKALERTIRSFAPDLVHAHYVPRISFGAFARAGRGLPRVMTFHSYHYECPKGGLYRKRGAVCTEKPSPCQAYAKGMMGWLRGVDRVIAISRFIERRLLEAGAARETVVWLPNGVPLEVEASDPPSASRTVLFVGRLEPNKGAEVLVRAFRMLESADVRLRIVGAGSQAGRLRELAGSDPRIEFPGWLARPEIAKAYRESRFLVLPSVYHEGLNTVACEAAAFGRPLIATDLGGNPDLVLDGTSGFFFPAGDSQALVDRMRTLLADDALTDSFGAASRRHIESFSIGRHLDSIERLYEELLGEPLARESASR